MKIHAIRTGSVAIKSRQRKGVGPGPARLAATLLDRSWTEPLPIYAWLIEHPEGPIVIDTGETARVEERGYFPAWHPYFRLGLRSWVKPEEEIGPSLRTLGIDPDEVRWVVMTHLHTDQPARSLVRLSTRTMREAVSSSTSPQLTAISLQPSSLAACRV